MLKTTKQHKEYWKTRDIDWKAAYFDIHNHPHRDLIINKLKGIRFGSLVEIGCASGPNLYRVARQFPKVRVGGIDVSPKAIETARKLLPPNAVLDTGSGEDMYFNDKSVDVVLTDMTLIYFDKKAIHKVMKEIARIARNDVILCEFHSKKLLRRMSLRWNSGYFAYNYARLLRKYGFYDISIEKVQEKDWPGGNPQKEFAYIIHGKI